MTKHPLKTKTRIDLRTILSASVLAVLVLVCAGTAAGVGAGAEWEVHLDAGTPIQDAIDGAWEGDTIYVHEGTYDENVDVDKQVTLIGDGAAQHTGSPTNHKLDFNTPSDGIHAMLSHHHPFYFGNGTITKARTHSNNGINASSCLSFDPLAGIRIYNVWMTNRTTFNRTAEAYIFSPEDFIVYTHFSCYVCEDPLDVSIAWIDPDGNRYHTTTFYDIEEGYHHWRGNIYVKGCYPEDHLGEWQAYVYFNGELISIKRFWIGTPAPSSSNSPPVAEIGDNQTIHIGDTFVTDGHKLCDSDGNIMSHNWSRKRSYWSEWRNWSIIRDVWYTTDWSPVFEPFLYDFILTVTDDDGATDTTRKQMIIEPTAWDLADDDSDGISNVLDRNPDEPDRHISWEVGKYAVYDVIEDGVVVGSHRKTIMPPVLINGYTFCVLRHSGYYNVTSYLALDGWCYKETVNNRTYFYVAADREDILWNYTETGPVNITTPAGTFECYGVDVKGYRDECLIQHNAYWQPTPWSSVGWNIKVVLYNVSTGVPRRTWILTDYSRKPVCGDLNNDTQITPADAVIALHIAASGGWNEDADVSGDDRVTSLDALMILQAAAGRIEL